MSETSRGEGWWLASDGRWYPPEDAPAQTPPLTPSNAEYDYVEVHPEPAEATPARRWWASWKLLVPVALILVVAAFATLEVVGMAGDRSDVEDGEAAFASGNCTTVREIAQDLEGYRFPFNLGGSDEALADEVAECDAYAEAIEAASAAYLGAECNGLSDVVNEITGERWPFSLDDDLAKVGRYESECQAWQDAKAIAEENPGSAVLALLTIAGDQHDSALAEPAVADAREIVALGPADAVASEDLCSALHIFERVDVPNSQGAIEVWLACVDRAATSENGVVTAIERLDHLVTVVQVSEEILSTTSLLAAGLTPAEQGLALDAVLDPDLRGTVLGTVTGQAPFCSWMLADGSEFREATAVLRPCVVTLEGAGDRAAYVNAVLLLAAQVQSEELEATLAPLFGAPELCTTPGGLSGLDITAEVEGRHLRACLGLELEPSVRAGYLLTLAEDYGDEAAIAELNLSRPANGTEIESGARGGTGELTISNQFDHDVLYVLDRGDTRIAVYLHGGASHTMYGIQDGAYEDRVAEGRYWDGETRLFRVDLGAFRSDQTLDFTTTYDGTGGYTYSIWEITLNPTADDPGESSGTSPIDSADVLN